MKRHILNNLKRMILLVGIVFFVSCENNIDKIKLITDIDKRPSATAENIVVNYTKNGRLEMKLFAPLLEQYSWNKDAPYNEFKKGIKVLFYSEEGELQSTLNADYAKYYMNKKLWEVRDNVEMINPDGDKLTTNLMYADENSQKMYSDEYVKITTQDGTEISGKRGFISNFDFTEYSFKNVSGIINVKENK